MTSSFKEVGNGHWELDTGAGGGVILDETGGSKDPSMGFGGKVFSARAWDYDYNHLGEEQMFSTRKQAEKYIKDTVRRYAF